MQPLLTVARLRTLAHLKVEQYAGIRFAVSRAFQSLSCAIKHYSDLTHQATKQASNPRLEPTNHCYWRHLIHLRHKMESVAIVGATYPHSPAPSRNELRSICTATQSTSISFTVSPTSLAKRTHDEISASLVSDKSEGEAQRCRAQRPRLISTEPAMNDGGLFAWARRSLG